MTEHSETHESTMATLLKEYEVVVSLYMHEDEFLLRTVEISILINTALAAVAKLLTGPPWVNVLIGVLGIATCISWRVMVFSNKIHHDLRAFRAREIETEMGRMGTFGDEAAIFYYKKPVEFHDLHEPSKPQVFKPLTLRPRVFATVEYLPMLVALAWFGFICASFARP